MSQYLATAFTSCLFPDQLLTAKPGSSFPFPVLSLLFPSVLKHRFLFDRLDLKFLTFEPKTPVGSCGREILISQSSLVKD